MFIIDPLSINTRSFNAVFPLVLMYNLLPSGSEEHEVLSTGRFSRVGLVFGNFLVFFLHYSRVWDTNMLVSKTRVKI